MPQLTSTGPNPYKRRTSDQLQARTVAVSRGLHPAP